MNKLPASTPLRFVDKGEMRCPDCGAYIGDMYWGDVVVVCPKAGCHKAIHFQHEIKPKENQPDA